MTTDLSDQRTLLQRYLPHPLLTIALVLLWVALLNSFTIGGWLLGIILGMLIPYFTGQFWPERPVIHRPLLAFSFILLLFYDVFVANLQVAYLITFRRSSDLKNRWVTVPLDLISPEGITVLAGTITLTPGTVSSDLSADGRALLVHCLDARSDQDVVDRIKNRYEARIKAMLP